LANKTSKLSNTIQPRTHCKKLSVHYHYHYHYYYCTTPNTGSQFELPFLFFFFFFFNLFSKKITQQPQNSSKAHNFLWICVVRM
jgi:hypothetical protein